MEKKDIDNKETKSKFRKPPTSELKQHRKRQKNRLTQNLKLRLPKPKKRLKNLPRKHRKVPLNLRKLSKPKRVSEVYSPLITQWAHLVCKP